MTGSVPCVSVILFRSTHNGDSSDEYFVEKHAFQGQAAQLQLTFLQGAKISAKRERLGGGVPTMAGRLVPPSYVPPPAAAPAPASFAPQIQAAAQTMQQRMKQATFTSFVENPRKPVQSKIEVSAMRFGCRDSGTMSTLKTNSNSTRMSRRKPPDTARFFASAACTCSPRSQPT